MLEKYIRIEKYFYKDKQIYSSKNKYWCHENPDWVLSGSRPKSEMIILNWKTIGQEYSKLKCAPFYIKETKKGRKFKTYWDVADTHPEARLNFKEWKEDFEIIVTIDYVLIIPKLREIINDWPAPYAINYLKDRGFSVCSLKEIENVN